MTEGSERPGRSVRSISASSSESGALPTSACTGGLRVTDQALTLELCGTLDLWSVPALAGQFDQLVHGHQSEVTLDLRHVHVIDHLGCHAIALLAHFVTLRGDAMRIVCMAGVIPAVLGSIGLGAHLDVVAPADAPSPAGVAVAG
ncbi:MAG: STAS domain-containing protein [Acidimicrobiales bacterium]